MHWTTVRLFHWAGGGGGRRLTGGILAGRLRKRELVLGATWTVLKDEIAGPDSGSSIRGVSPIRLQPSRPASPGSSDLGMRALKGLVVLAGSQCGVRPVRPGCCKGGREPQGGLRGLGRVTIAYFNISPRCSRLSLYSSPASPESPQSQDPCTVCKETNT